MPALDGSQSRLQKASQFLSVAVRYSSASYRLFSGDDAIAQLPRELERLAVRSVLLVTSPSVYRSGLPERLQVATRNVAWSVFGEVVRESPLPTVRAVVERLHSSAADAVIALGGGSVIVTARAATVLLAETDTGSRAVRPLPTVVVPTTATTAIARAGAAVWDPETGTRKEIFHPDARPAVVLIDDKALATSPAGVFKSAAVAAFCSAAELMTVPALNPFASSDLRQALELLVENLSGHEANARVLMTLAAVLVGRAADALPGISPGVTLALSHQLQYRYPPIDQGSALSAMLPAGLRFNSTVVGLQQRRLAEALGAPESESVDRAIVRFLRTLGFPTRLRDTDARQDEFRAIAVASMESFFVRANARRVGSADDLVSVLADAW